MKEQFSHLNYNVNAKLNNRQLSYVQMILRLLSRTVSTISKCVTLKLKIYIRYL